MSANKKRGRKKERGRKEKEFKEAIEQLKQKYDFSLAAQARRVLLLETHTGIDRQNLVWRPTRKMLQEIAEKGQKSLVCLTTKPIRVKDREGYFAHIDFAGPNNCIAYLGTAVNKQEAEENMQRHLKYQSQRHLVKMLRQKGPMTIIFEQTRCAIPIDTEELNQSALEEAIRRFLAIFAPKIKRIKINWLPEKEQQLLEYLIWDKAEKTAKPQTKEEKMRIIQQDIE